jgi:hypothetical protein
LIQFAELKYFVINFLRKRYRIATSNEKGQQFYFVLYTMFPYIFDHQDFSASYVDMVVVDAFPGHLGRLDGIDNGGASHGSLRLVKGTTCFSILCNHGEH